MVSGMITDEGTGLLRAGTIEVVLQVFPKDLDRLVVYPGASALCLDSFPRVHHCPLRDVIRLRLVDAFLPLSWLTLLLDGPGHSLRSTSLSGASSLLRSAPPLLSPSVFPTCLELSWFSLLMEQQVPTFRIPAQTEVMPPLRRMPHGPYARSRHACPRVHVQTRVSTSSS